MRTKLKALRLSFGSGGPVHVATFLHIVSRIAMESDLGWGVRSWVLTKHKLLCLFCRGSNAETFCFSLFQRRRPIYDSVQ